MDRAILVPFSDNSNQIYKIIRLEDLELKAKQYQAYLHKVLLDSLVEDFLEIPLRVVYFLRLLRLNHHLS